MDVPSLQLSLATPDELAVGGGPDHPFGLSLAPDGRRLAFAALQHGVSQLWLRDLTRDDLQPLPNTAGGVLPFWSPDGASLGFFAAGKMRVFVFADGSVRDLADAPSPRGAAWHANGDILFAPASEGPLLRRGPDGRIAPFTALESGVESSHRYPSFVEGSRYVLFYVRASEPTREGIWLASYDQPTNRKRLVRSDAFGLSVGPALVYSSEGALIAQRLDLETTALTGRTILLGTPVGRGQQHQLFATAAADVLIFGVPRSNLRELRWFDRAGAADGVLGEPMDARDVRISPSGGTVAVTRADPQMQTLDIWTYEAERPLPQRVSPAIDADETPAWSPDGRQLAWITGRRALTRRDARIESADVTLRKFEPPVAVTDWAAGWIVLTQLTASGGSDIVLLSPAGSGEPRPYAQSTFNESFGAVSPDGTWLAYASDESGRFEIYVDAFPEPGRRARLTVGGGAEPRWGRDGREIFFRRGSEIHAARLGFTPGGTPEAVSSQRLFDAGADIRAFDASPDGQRFLLNLPAPDNAAKPMTVLVNVRTLLKLLEPNR